MTELQVLLGLVVLALLVTAGQYVRQEWRRYRRLERVRMIEARLAGPGLSYEVNGKDRLW